jgi:uncharacterized protein
MANSSNFRQAIAEAQGQSLRGPNVISKALPFLGAGLLLTAVGTYGGLGMLVNQPDLFPVTQIAAMVVSLILFFVAQWVAEKGNKAVALPMLGIYSLLTGYTLSALVAYALGTVGLMGLATAAGGCGVTFIGASLFGRKLSDQDGMALTQTIFIGIAALCVVTLLQVVLSMFGIYTPGWMEIAISGLGVLLFVGSAVVDFYILPRTYDDEQYLPAALSMYLTYINLFVFILRLLIALRGDD